MKYDIQKQITEREIVDAVDVFLRKSGYRVVPQLRIRTWRPDIVGIRGDELVIVEAKGYQSDMRRALAQVALYSTDATSAYLALPMERIRKDVRETAKVLGIGLIGVDDKAKIELKALATAPRASLLKRIHEARNAVAHSASQPRTSKFSALDRLLRHRRVIEILLARPERRFTIRELSRESRASYSTTWRIARDLESLGAVVSERVGTSRVLSANQDAPIVRELKQLGDLELAPHRLAAREFAGLLADVTGVRRAILFGSVARGTEAATSDVDIAIVLKKKDESVVGRVFDVAEGIQDRTRMKIVPLFVTESELKSKSRLAESIKSGEVLLERS